jgi:hypothetical protein
MQARGHDFISHLPVGFEQFIQKEKKETQYFEGNGKIAFVFTVFAEDPKNKIADDKADEHVDVRKYARQRQPYQG